ncbi:MAG: KpsF/GutQ family sugar-phosphate isomerase [Halorhodospira halophila]|uniref:KpsF/GutQ family sugar-phosphate isomerase n=1 Tax=Halorhodospira TaxID=85108 RepID=UPI001EE8FA70|nr:MULTISPECIES: KpsF/GutQ family sugar-phosphate isomerase [Halorhodospira]MBK5944435.1 D-arabinose 5-phosphate isomerase [Halorhodospira halophila]MCC3750562.1 KpsF/GutQ family sugar-phosphate isomerase [Halorhodospira halophila]MCG5527444.1 KpsF/GutQ family sugar-phosphate isomerase [Halorhodospira halophila]MCG5532836.1 KpsF/GutQ family sugar-phosphate isomerase [Halorhodospira sp. 9621]MCG5541088.1 KpsF/GutQ family sugar-phosphate isomerase [Halorhodospira sp. M39old]
MTPMRTLIERHQGAPEEGDERLRALGRAVLQLEADAVAALGERIDQPFSEACRHMLACRGRVIVTGMGKSGHIGSKMAATLASTGTPAFFVHPGEASHGDLGMVTPDDVVIALSNSGETDELTAILPLIKRLGVPLIALTGRPESTLARAASVHLNVGVEQEACPLGLAPTASTTATLAMGDALAVALLDARGFTAEDFARSHPGGKLGRRLLLHIEDIMQTGERIPRVAPGTALRDALLEISRKGLGMTAIVDEEQRVLGIFTDGDLRRTLDRGADIHQTPIEAVMSLSPQTASPDLLAAEAAERMERHRINALLVTDAEDRLVGALNMHDLLRAGVV